MATDPRDIQLTEEQQKNLAAKAKATGRTVSELVDEFLASKPQRPPRKPREGRSLLDAMKDHGMVGTMHGPGDLSTNPKHMEGFGESRVETDSN